MPTPECLGASARRLERAKNRVAWQQRLLAKTSDPVVHRVGRRVLFTLEEIVATLTEAHELLIRRSQHKDPPVDGP